MRITFVTRKFGNVERNSHCDVLHITPIRVAKLFLVCNGDFAIKAYTTKGFTVGESRVRQTPGKHVNKKKSLIMHIKTIFVPIMRFVEPVN